MHKKRKIEEEENQDRWVVSYADFITLLFAFFTTMYAISHVDLGKLERFSGSMKSAFKTSGAGDLVKGTVINGIRPINYADIGLEKDVLAELKKFGIIEAIAVVRDQRGVLISFGDSLFFESGSAELRRESRPFLSSVASLIKKYHRDVLIEGHTDNLPVHNSTYSSNIELSCRQGVARLCFSGERGRGQCGTRWAWPVTVNTGRLNRTQHLRDGRVTGG